MITKTRSEQQEDYKKMVELNPSTLHCKKCLGRGYVAWDIKNSYYIPCECLLKAMFKIEMKKLAEKETSEN